MSKQRKLPERTLNIWNKYDFLMCGLGEKNMLIARLKHIKRCLKWSGQRITRGYADCDLWSKDNYLQKLLPDMLKKFKDTRHGSPAELGENYTNEQGHVVNDTCHEEWDKILDRMIFLWRETDEETCSKKNPYEEEHRKAYEEFDAKYGMLGEGLLTDEEREESKKGRGTRVHFMSELPEYKEISEKYEAAERELATYRDKCKDEAMDLMKRYFWDLWD